MTGKCDNGTLPKLQQSWKCGFISCGGSGEVLERMVPDMDTFAWAIPAEDSVSFEKYFKFGKHSQKLFSL